MTYCIKIEHKLKGLSSSHTETIFSESCNDSDEDFKIVRKKQLEKAKAKFEILSKEYKNEIFLLIEFKYENKIIDETINVKEF